MVETVIESPLEDELFQTVSEDDDMLDESSSLLEEDEDGDQLSEDESGSLKLKLNTKARKLTIGNKGFKDERRPTDQKKSAKNPLTNPYF